MDKKITKGLLYNLNALAFNNKDMVIKTWNEQKNIIHELTPMMILDCAQIKKDISELMIHSHYTEENCNDMFVEGDLCVDKTMDICYSCNDDDTDTSEERTDENNIVETTHKGRKCFIDSNNKLYRKNRDGSRGDYFGRLKNGNFEV